MRIKCVQSKNPHKSPSLFPFAIYQNQVSEFYIFFVYIYNHLALQIMLKQLILKSPPICLGWVCKKTVYYMCVYILTFTLLLSSSRLSWKIIRKHYQMLENSDLNECQTIYPERRGYVFLGFENRHTKKPTNLLCPVSRNTCIQNWTINVSVN